MNAMRTFFNYYGFDWLAMGLSLWAVYLLGNKSRRGFLVFAAANAIWIALGFGPMKSLGIGIGNVIFLIMNTRGYIEWGRQSARTPVAAQPERRDTD